MTYPYKKRWQRMGWMPRDDETWAQFYKRTSPAPERIAAIVKGEAK